MVHAHTFVGSRTKLVQPRECFDEDTIKGLSGYRVSFIDQTAADLFVINDVWNGWFRERAFPEAWAGSVAFLQQGNPVTMPTWSPISSFPGQAPPTSSATSADQQPQDRRVPNLTCPSRMCVRMAVLCMTSSMFSPLR